MATVHRLHLVDRARGLLSVVSFLSHASSAEIVRILTSKPPRLDVHGLFEGVADSYDAPSHFQFGLLDVLLGVRRKSRSLDGRPLATAADDEGFALSLATARVLGRLEAALPLALDDQGRVLAVLAVETAIEFVPRIPLLHVSPVAFDLLASIFAQIEVLADRGVFGGVSDLAMDFLDEVCEFLVVGLLGLLSSLHVFFELVLCHVDGAVQVLELQIIL